MRPDYPHKIFADERGNYFLLMETLAIDKPLPLAAGCAKAAAQ